MNLEQINAMGLRLYREPELWEPIQDAICELAPPLTWAEWLDRSGILENLARLTIAVQGGPTVHDGFNDIPNLRRHLDWLWEIGIPRTIRANEINALWPDVISAFRVPAVQIEWRSGFGDPDVITRWRAASIPLAMTLMRECLTPRGLWPPEWELPISFDVEQAVRDNHPSATSYRIRLGDGKWSPERDLRRPILEV